MNGKSKQVAVGTSLILLLTLFLGACADTTNREAFPTPANNPNAGQIIAPPINVKDARLTFPEDEAPHNNITEWWYYTGHLETTDGQRYGFEYVIFQRLAGNFSVAYVSHFAITDLSKNSFKYDQRASLAQTGQVKVGGKDGFKLAVTDWTMQGLAGQEKLKARMQDGSYAIDLQATDQKGIALHGSGLFSYDAAGFSYYYSRPQMAITGSLSVDGQLKPIKSGQAWFDHQWGDFISLAGGWDWFSLQLEDNSQIMVYYLRDVQNNIYDLFGSYIPACPSNAECNPAGDKPVKSIALVKKDFLLQPLAEWKSLATGAVYPSGWNLKIKADGVPAFDLTITPQLKDQELNTRTTSGVIYWEGACAVSGTKDGQAIKGNSYVELTGYATSNPK